jgi:hypothetical protein
VGQGHEPRPVRRDLTPEPDALDLATISTDQFFAYKFDRRFSAVLAALGVRRGTDGVTVTASGEVRATFGRFRLVTTLDNVVDGHVTELYSWYKAIGVRLSFVDDGLTFGTNTARGVCVHFQERVPPVVGRRPHSALTVTVDDCAGLLAALDPGTA